MLRMFLAALFISTALAIAAEPAKIPPSADTAGDALKNSTRHGEWVDIPVGDVKLRTWVVYPERKEKAGVVLVIHEIFGLTDWVRGVADQLAADGFIAVAPDMLSGKGPDGGGTESLGDKVREAIRTLTPDDVAKRLDAARDWALAQPAANGKSATIGFCWGGAQSFNYATHQPKLNAAIVYYGAAPKEPEALSKIQAPVLGLYGSDDARINAGIEPAKKAMEELKKSYTPHIYDGAGHGFLRQQSARQANQKASEQAWPQTISFLKKNLE